VELSNMLEKARRLSQNKTSLFIRRAEKKKLLLPNS